MKIILSESQYYRLIESVDEAEKEESILIIGDSHSVDAGFTYSSLIKNNFKNVKIAAIGGKRTSWMVSELSNQLSKQHYDKVVIWGGANDMFSNVSISEAISNIQKMVDMVNSQDGQAYVIVGFDQRVFSKKGKYKATKYANPDQLDKMREKYIDFQESLPSGISNATVIDSFDIDNSHTSDNMHGNGPAHRQVYSIVSDYLSKKNDNKKVEKIIEKEKGLQVIERLKKYMDEQKSFSHEDGESSIPFEPEVKDIQTGLQFLGFSLPEWGVDGKFGKETKSAVEEFQKSIKAEITGIMNSETISNLIEELEKRDFDEEDLSKIITKKTESLEIFKPSENIVIDNPGVKVRTYPSDLMDRFEKISDGYSDTFISDVKSIGLDPVIAVRQLYTESAFSPEVMKCKRKSSAGAMGIAQFMPGTWPTYGSGNPCNVRDSLKAYVRFMDYLLKRFPGRPDIAVASYNSGPNLKIYKKALNDNLAFQSLKGRIPNETYKYAASIFQP
jgi:soluble cytochrome b562